MLKRALYRVSQFLRAWRESPSAEDLKRAEAFLSPELFALFGQMLPFEQAHSIRVHDTLVAQGYSQPDLLAAALLHDVGKVKFPLKPWQRALAVLVQKFFPNQVLQLGQGRPVGLLKGIVVAEQHARWGAEIAEAAGAARPVVRLIALHQDKSAPQLDQDELILLIALQSVDKVS